MAVQDWSSVAASNTSVGGISTDGTVTLVKQIDNMFRGMMADIRTGINAGYFVNSTFASKSGNYTAVVADRGSLLHFTAAATLTLTAAATLTAGWWIMVRARGAAVLIDPNASELVNGLGSLIIPDGTSATIFCDGTGFYTLGDYQLAPKDSKSGLILSNNASDATNDIDITAGECASDTSPFYRMVLASALTKRLDAAWAVGSGNGGLDTGSITNTSYHVWLIQRSDTGVVDALFSTSATAPTMPANYDRKRRLGGLTRSAGSILGFVQTGKTFMYNTMVVSRSNTAALVSTLLTFAVPIGIQVEPIIYFTAGINVNSTVTTTVGSAAAIIGQATTPVMLLSSSVAVTSSSYVNGGFLTNTSQQAYLAVTIGAGTLTQHTTNTAGWIDTYL